VLINNNSFEGCKGLDLNVHLEQMGGRLYSFVSDAVVRVGADILEVQKEQSLFFNKQRIDVSRFPLSVGGFPATDEVTNKCFDIVPIHKCVSDVTVNVHTGAQYPLFRGLIRSFSRPLFSKQKRTPAPG
jgi:hypothetical protein